MYIIVLNPVSGKHDPKLTKHILRQCMRLHNKDFIIIETDKHGKHRDKIREYHDERNVIFVAVGGDGTVSELVNILADIKPIIGIIPTGSANSMARELGIPLNVQDACVAMLTSTRMRKMGVLAAFDKLFILDISVGINALVMRDTSRQEKRIWGIFAYIQHALRWLFTFKSKKFTVTIDGITHKRRATDVIVANGGIVKALLKRVAGYPGLTRQHFEVIITKTRTPRDYLSFLFSFILGPLNKDRGVEVIRLKKSLRIDCSRELPVQGDGDIIGKVPVNVTLHHRAFSIIIPEDAQ